MPKSLLASAWAIDGGVRIKSFGTAQSRWEGALRRSFLIGSDTRNYCICVRNVQPSAVWLSMHSGREAYNRAR
jgi:hypothetical protein